MKTLIAAIVTTASMVVGAAVELIVQEGVGTATGSGTLNLGETQKLSELRLRPDGDGFVFTGAGFAFTDVAATVRFQSFVPTVFDTPVSASGGLAFRFDASMTLAWENGFLSTSAESPTTLFTDFTLADYVPVTGLSGGKSAIDLPMVAFHTQRGEGWLTTQMQTMADSSFCKCVLVRLEQRGADVVGWITGAKYLPVADYGADFSTRGISVSAVMSDALDGYGLKRLSMMRGSAETGAVSMTKPLRADGALRVGEKISLTADGSDVLSEGGLVTNVLELAGALVVTNTPGTVYSNDWTGAGGALTFGGYHKKMAENRFESMFPVPWPYDDVWQVAATNAILSCLTNVEITAYSGGAIPSVPNPDGQTFHLRQDGDKMVCQCQQEADSYLKCIRLQFRQNGDDVEVKLLDAWYTDISTGRGVDLDTLPEGSGEKDTKKFFLPHSAPEVSGYGVGGFVLYFSQEPIDASASVRTLFVGPNDMTGATIAQNGGYANVTHKDGLPESGVYTVNGGTLELSADGCDLWRGVSQGGTRLVVKNGVLVQSNYNVIDGLRQVVELDNSELRLSASRGTYVNALTLRNGSRVTTATPLLTYNANATWTVEGVGASSCEQMVRPAAPSPLTVTFDVGETTGDAAADLDLKGGIQPYDTYHSKWTLDKKGAGTLQLSAESCWCNAANLSAGELRVKGSGILKVTPEMSCPVMLQGGTLSFTENTSNSVGVISVSANSTLALAEGSVVAAADASGATWAKAVKLAVTGPSVNSGERTGLRFGTTTCLTAGQLRAMRYNGSRVYQDDDGWVCVGTPGMLLLVR